MQLCGGWGSRMPIRYHADFRKGDRVNTILVTGGAGFVGSNLAMGVQQQYPDARVVALDNLKRRGSELNLPRLKRAGIEFVHGDIRSPEDIAATGDADLLLECSAEPSALAGYGESPRYLLDANLGGTINCLEYARQCGASMIFLSSSRVYPIAALYALDYSETETRFELHANQSAPGATASGITEDFPLEGRRTLYGATKLASELIIQEYVSMYDMRAVIDRCGVIAGPWQMGKVDQGVVALWAARHYFKLPLQYIGFGGTGKQVRDVLHIEDLIDLVVHQMENLDTLNGAVLNVGGGRKCSTSLVELTRLCAEKTGNEVSITAVPETTDADIPIYLTDNARVRDRCGWSPKRTMEDIVGDIVDWIDTNCDAVQAVFAPTE